MRTCVRFDFQPPILLVETGAVHTNSQPTSNPSAFNTLATHCRPYRLTTMDPIKYILLILVTYVSVITIFIEHYWSCANAPQDTRYKHLDVISTPGLLKPEADYEKQNPNHLLDPSHCHTESQHEIRMGSFTFLMNQLSSPIVHNSSVNVIVKRKKFILAHWELFI